MSAPNIRANTGTINGKVAGVALTASATTILANAASSGKVYRVSSLYCANVDGTTAYTVTVDVKKNAGTQFRLAYQVNVPAGGSVLIIGKDGPIYLEENDTLEGLGSTTLKIEAVCSYEDIS